MPLPKPVPDEKTTYTKCKNPSCELKIPNHHWGRIKADNWFQQKNGDIWCPEHIPEWVAKWRDRNLLA